MKQTCNGCRAFESKCILGFKQKTKDRPNMLASGVISQDFSPAEECPKPRTYEKLTLALWYKAMK